VRRVNFVRIKVHKMNHHTINRMDFLAPSVSRTIMVRRLDGRGYAQRKNRGWDRRSISKSTFDGHLMLPVDEVFTPGCPLFCTLVYRSGPECHVSMVNWSPRIRHVE
jgi:hypothetical protein